MPIGENELSIEELKNAMVRKGIASDSDIRGCSPEEIAQVEKSMGTSLPKVYHDFLAIIGHKAGRLFVGSDIFFPKMLGHNAYAVYLLEENESDSMLPDDAVVFLVHQGYQFMFLRSSEGEDPPVYYYHESGNVIEKKWPSFLEFLWVGLDSW